MKDKVPIKEREQRIKKIETTGVVVSRKGI
jgi:hypothetical protein